MSKIIIALSVALLSGCSTIGKIASYAASANDDAVTSAEFTICNAASVGSIKRKFNTPEKVKVWKELCDDRTDFNP